MGMRPRAQPSRVIGLLDPLFYYMEITVASGVVTNVVRPEGFAVGTFAAGVAALTFPRHFRTLMLVKAQENTRGAPTTEHDFDLRTVNVSLGTAVIVTSDKLAGTEENPVDGTIRLLFLSGE